MSGLSNFYYFNVLRIKNSLSRAVPLKKLCEYEGQSIPKDAKRDCYNNVDETEFACKEKYRIMVSNLAN